MLAWLDHLLWGASTRRGLLASRGFWCLRGSARLIDTRRGTLAVHRSALSCLALEPSVEHSAGEDGFRSVATESQGQHPNKSRQYQRAKQAHANSPFDQDTSIMT